MSQVSGKVALFFGRIKNGGFWDRILPWTWRSIRPLSYEAYSEYQQLVDVLRPSPERRCLRIFRLVVENPQGQVSYN